MDFRQGTSGRKPPRNYLSRREQHRLFFLVGTLALVVFLISQAAKPSTWAWLWGKSETPATVSVKEFFDGPAEYDTRVRPTSPEQLPLDTFLAPAPRVESKTEPSGKALTGLKPELLSSVRDHTVFRPAEVDAWYNLLTTLKNADEATIEKESLGLKSFVQLYEQSAEYRGKLVTVKGIAKRAFDLQAPKNEHGISGFYQIWLQPEGGPLSPIVIYALELPQGFPTSRIPNSKAIAEIYEPIEVTGYFYKNWAYATGTTILSAPLIVAKTVDWRPKAVVQKEPVTSWQVWGAIALSLLLGVGFTVVMMRAGRPQANPKLSELATRYQTPALQELANEDLGPDVGETLRALAEAAETTPSETQPEPSQP